MFDDIIIKSSSGFYSVKFVTDFSEIISEIDLNKNHFLVDSNVAKIYSKFLFRILEDPKTIKIEATEKNKSIENVVSVMTKLINNNIKRDQSIIAIGGGIIQDITCFIASTLFRGVNWEFIPTTLLAQADSCIGSKSSINLGSTKNILGTFLAPRKVYLLNNFLNTLDKKDINSGIGEILKVHAIAGQNHFLKLQNDFNNLVSDSNLLGHYIRDSLIFKKKYIELDEFDKGARNIFNYGHSFGHAIESATNFSIPHGIAVSIGMDMANHISVMRNLIPKKIRNNMHKILKKNYFEYKNIHFSLDDLIKALLKDKKNTHNSINLILPAGEKAELNKIKVLPDKIFISQCSKFIDILRK